MRRKYEQARKLRKAMTDAEKLLWYRIRARGEDAPIFRRPYALGQYILDFYCIRAKLAVDVDGYFHGTDEGYARDVLRDAWLVTHGVEVYRIPAADVFADADGVADGVILKASGFWTRPSPHHHSLRSWSPSPASPAGKVGRNKRYERKSTFYDAPPRQGRERRL